MSASTLNIAVPGQLLGPVSQYQPGPGTHLHAGAIYASIAGPLHVQASAKPAGPAKRLTKITAAEPAPLPTVSVVRDGGAPALDTKPGPVHAAKKEVMPEVGSTVLCKVTRVTPRQASAAILVVGETVLDGEWQGVIRVQDVRATEKDRVRVFESFRPGDVVRATVVCLVPSPLLFVHAEREREDAGRWNCVLRGCLRGIRGYGHARAYFFSFTSLHFPSPHVPLLTRAVPADLPRRPVKLLPLDGQQQPRRHHGHERGRQRHVPRQLEGIQGPGDRAERAAQGRQALLRHRAMRLLTDD